MDEEDIREAEESRTLATSEEFAGFGTEQDVIRKSAAIDVFQPAGEPVGSRLLKKMGWREGTGIGPRVRRTANFEEEDGDKPTETYLFAPDDVLVVTYSKKTDYSGLGYERELDDQNGFGSQASNPVRETVHPKDLSDDEGVSTLFTTKKKSTPARKRTGFGSGVLNDDGLDDEDPYAMGPKISYNKTLGREKRDKSKAKSLPGSVNPLLKKKPTFISKRLANMKGALRKCHDGRLPLDGFVLADELDAFGTMTLLDDKYKPPAVPEDWIPSLPADAKAEMSTNFVSTAEAAKASNLTAKGRASLLGESQLPGKSVFDFLTPAARDRLVLVSGQQDLPAAGDEPAPNSNAGSTNGSDTFRNLVPRLDREIAVQALARGASGWMPYAEDETKRSRYRTYLEIQAGLRAADELPPRAQHMRQDDWVIELQEFARAAEVFKPISGLMASRFTTSSSALQGSDGKLGNGPEDSLLSKPKAKPQDPAEEAAKLGMFGPLTRTITNFYPTRLLCKRFGTAMPTHAEAGNAPAGSGTSSTAPESSFTATHFRSFASAEFLNNEPPGSIQKDAKKQGNQQPVQGIKEENLASMDPDRNEALEQERPGQAVFKAIFGSDDEDD